MAKISTVNDMFIRSISFFVYGVALASLFVWCMMQGLMLHLSGDSLSAFPYYFISWVAGIGGLALYWQARNLYHFAEISK